MENTEPKLTARKCKYFSDPFNTCNSLVSVESNSDTKNEFLHIVLDWMGRQGYAGAAHVLQSEAITHHKSEKSLRKILVTLLHEVEEQNWENTTKSMQRLSQLIYSKEMNASTIGALRSPLVQLVNTLPFLVAQQQFLELIGCDDDGFKAYHFFVKNIKPLEQTLESYHFSKLNYLLTCKSVSDASHLYPEYDRWSPAIGCAQLISFINRILCGTSLLSVSRTSFSEDGTSLKDIQPLETYIEQAISFRLLSSKIYKNASSREPPIRISSLSTSLRRQLPAVQPIASLDIASLFSTSSHSKRKNITPTCSLFIPLSNAIAVGLSTGDILSISTDFLKQDVKIPIVPHKYIKIWKLDGPIKGIQYSTKQKIVFCWGPNEACLVQSCSFDHCISGNNSSDCTLQVLDFERTVNCACLLPLEKMVGTGCSDGSVSLWDATSGSRLYKRIVGSGSSVVALISNRLGTVFYAGSQEGVIQAIDAITGIYLFCLIPPIPMEIAALALSPSSSFLLAAYRGGTLRLWDTVTGQEVLPHFLNNESTVRRISISFGARDQHVFCGQEDGTVLFWDTSMYSMLPEAHHVGTSSASNPEYLASTLHYPTLRLHLHRSSVNHLSAIDGYLLLSSGSDGFLSICSSLQHIE